MTTQPNSNGPDRPHLKRLFAELSEELAAFKVEAYRNRDTQMLAELDRLEETLRDAYDDFKQRYSDGTP